jgi:hypothetical protein
MLEINKLSKINSTLYLNILHHYWVDVTESRLWMTSCVSTPDLKNMLIVCALMNNIVTHTNKLSDYSMPISQ